MFLSFDPKKKPISQKIGEKFSISASKLDCKKIHEILGIRRAEPKGLLNFWDPPPSMGHPRCLGDLPKPHNPLQNPDMLNLQYSGIKKTEI